MHHLKNLHLGVYGGFGATGSLDTGLGVTGALSFTRHNYETSRLLNAGAVTRTAIADYAGTSLSGQLRGRYGMDVDLSGMNLVVSPLLGVDLGSTRNNAFTETGAGGLNITAQASSTRSLKSVVGLEVGQELQLGEATAIGSLSLEWHREFGDTFQTTSMKLAGSPTQFNTVSAVQSRDNFTLGGSLNVDVTDQLSISFNGAGTLSKTSRSASGSFVARFEF